MWKLFVKLKNLFSTSVIVKPVVKVTKIKSPTIKKSKKVKQKAGRDAIYIEK